MRYMLGHKFRYFNPDDKCVWYNMNFAENYWCRFPYVIIKHLPEHIDGLVQDCSNPSALAMELLQSCTKPSICNLHTEMN